MLTSRAYICSEGVAFTVSSKNDIGIVSCSACRKGDILGAATDTGEINTSGISSSGCIDGVGINIYRGSGRANTINCTQCSVARRGQTCAGAGNSLGAVGCEVASSGNRADYDIATESCEADIRSRGDAGGVEATIARLSESDICASTSGAYVEGSIAVRFVVDCDISIGRCGAAIDGCGAGINRDLVESGEVHRSGNHVRSFTVATCDATRWRIERSGSIASIQGACGNNVCCTIGASGG